MHASRDGSHKRVIRAIAVGNRINLKAAVTEASYCAELERIVGLALPHVAPDRANLLVLAELLGLPAALIGPRGALARRAHSSQTALTLLALANLPRVVTLRRRWKGISMVQALLLAHADLLYRPMVETLSRLAGQHHLFVVATTLAPRLRLSTDHADIRQWGRPGSRTVYVPESPEVYNAALVFGPDSALLGRVDKVSLTSSETRRLHLSAGKLEAVKAIETEAGRLGVAISLDAFSPEYLQHLDSQGAEIVVQNDANDMVWVGPGSHNDWQPDEWLNSVLGSVQPVYRNLLYNVCAMQTGNFFDLIFDGQSSITTRADTPPDPEDRAHNFVGVDEFRHSVTNEPLLGTLLAVAPWVAEDPILKEPALSLSQRRRRLAAVGLQLRPKGTRANQYRESVISADLEL
ncbi:MAG: nitrilase-related carbon-nitrogen hydrolase [Ktedonobacterales bacterium]